MFLFINVDGEAENKKKKIPPQGNCENISGI